MSRRSDHFGASSHALVIIIGGAIGFSAGFVWLRFSLIESCAFAALGMLLAWNFGGAQSVERPQAAPAKRVEPLIIAESASLIPLLSWPAPFPVDIPRSHAIAQTRPRRSNSPRCVSARSRHASHRGHSKHGRMVCHSRG